MTTETQTTTSETTATGPLMIRHGDILLIPRSAPETGTHGQSGERLVLAEGEATGHAHVLEGLSTAVRVRRQAYVHVMEPAMLRHEEHRHVEVPPGWYEIVRQRVYTPQAPRTVAD